MQIHGSLNGMNLLGWFHFNSEFIYQHQNTLKFVGKVMLFFFIFFCFYSFDSDTKHHSSFIAGQLLLFNCFILSRQCFVSWSSIAVEEIESFQKMFLYKKRHRKTTAMDLLFIYKIRKKIYLNIIVI